VTTGRTVGDAEQHGMTDVRSVGHAHRSKRLTNSKAMTVAFMLAVAGCGGLPQPEEPLSEVAVDRQQADAERAKDALITFIRGNPNLFEGHPDPDRLQGIALEKSDSGRYHLGKFEINVMGRWYSAMIGGDQAAVSYHGKFEIQPDGKWVASKPEVSYFHARL
jgi:hypothetical protein